MRDLRSLPPTTLTCAMCGRPDHDCTYPVAAQSTQALYDALDDHAQYVADIRVVLATLDDVQRTRPALIGWCPLIATSH